MDFILYEAIRKGFPTVMSLLFLVVVALLIYLWPKVKTLTIKLVTKIRS